MAKIGTRLKAFRNTHHLTQKQVADRFGVTQVHISNIEKGRASASKHLKTKILSTISDVKEKSFDFSLDLITDNCWDFACFTLRGHKAGDRVRVNKKSLDSKVVLFHCDASGSDSIAKYMSDHLIAGLESVLGTIQNDLICTPEFIYKSLNKMVKNTKELWRGAPSCNIFVFNRENKKVRILNAGMPNILWLTGKEQKKYKTVEEDEKWPPLGSAPKKILPFSREIKLKKGDTLFSFSDGFIDEFNAHTKLHLKTYVYSVSRSLKGDAESIGKKLLTVLAKILKPSAVTDDMSFSIISKK